MIANDDANEPRLPLNNQQIAASLEEVADLLEAQGANMYRVRAYRHAAETLRRMERQAYEVLDEQGREGLELLPGIGVSLARSIERLARTGKLGLLQRLRGRAGPESLFATLPGVGLEMASRIHEHLGIESLAELEAAAYDGSLARVPGMGPKRIRGIRESLAGRFRRPASSTSPGRQGSSGSAEQAPQSAEQAPQGEQAAEQPPVSELLDVDAEYRRKAKAGSLPRISPLRFNPTGEAWLPVLHTERGARHYTALYSNTARAHELGMTRDWVVIYRDDQGGHGQWTVVTARFGRLRGRRVVRGREAECMAYYSGQQQTAGT